MEISAGLDSLIDKCETKLTDLYEAIRDKLRGLAGTLGSAYEAVRGRTEKARKLKQIWDDERFRDAEALLLDCIWKLIRHIMPRSGSGKIVYGAGDPAGTASAMQAAAVLYPLYAGSIEVEPDFENQALDVDIDIRGRIRVAVVLAAAVRLLINKELRTMYFLARRVLKG